jgi:hypothetical protein
MSDTATLVAQSQPAEAQLIEMLMAPVVPRLIYVAAKLNLADRPSEGPRLPKISDNPRRHMRQLSTVSCAIWPV